MGLKYEIYHKLGGLKYEVEIFLSLHILANQLRSVSLCGIETSSCTVTCSSLRTSLHLLGTSTQIKLYS